MGEGEGVGVGEYYDLEATTSFDLSFNDRKVGC